MNIFRENKIKIFASLASGLLLLLTLISVLPSISFAGVGVDVNISSTNVTRYNGLNSVGGTSNSSTGYTGGRPKTFNDLIMNTIIGGMLTPIITLIISGAVVVFLWGVFKFIKSEGKEKEAGRDMMIWGIVGIFVMVSVWGLVNILRGTFNLNDAQVEISNVLP